jgi:hypothetical protein
MLHEIVLYGEICGSGIGPTEDSQRPDKVELNICGKVLASPGLFATLIVDTGSQYVTS